MQKREIILVCALLFVLVCGMFVYTYLAREAKEVTMEPPVSLPTVSERYSVDRIDGKHFYRDGVHTIVGEIAMPTPCDLLTYEATVAESMPEQVTFAFGVINNSEACAQVVTQQRFMVSATASEMADLRATFAGQVVELNLVEAASHETLEDFELYSKG